MKLIALILFVAASFSVKAQCDAPTGLTTSGISATAATASWSPVAGAASYNVDYKLSSSPDWITIANGTTSLQWTLSGLLASTSYDWRVRTNCTSGTSSYSQTQFTSGAPGSCMAPTGLTTTNITSSTATMNWNAVNGAIAYTVYYKPTSSTLWITASSGTFSTSYNLYGLSPNTSYEWRVYTNCSLTEASGFSSAQFSTSGTTTTPPASCPGPYDVSTNGTISGAALISLNTDVKGKVTPKYDIDFYKFTINTAGTFTVWLTTLPANYDLAVLNSNGQQIGVSQNKGSQNEFVSLNGEAGTYYAKVYPKGTANSSSSCYTLKVQTATATKAFTTAVTASANEVGINQDFAVNVFPNPAGDQLNVSVQGADQRSEIKVYNLMGKLVMQQGSSNMMTRLDISKLPAGIYLLNVNNGEETKSSKFVKQ